MVRWETVMRPQKIRVVVAAIAVTGASTKTLAPMKQKHVPTVLIRDAYTNAPKGSFCNWFCNEISSRYVNDCLAWLSTLVVKAMALSLSYSPTFPSISVEKVWKWMTLCQY